MFLWGGQLLYLMVGRPGVSSPVLVVTEKLRCKVLLQEALSGTQVLPGGSSSASGSQLGGQEGVVGYGSHDCPGLLPEAWLPASAILAHRQASSQWRGHL